MKGHDPIRRDSLVQFGYKFDHASTCKDCGVAIEWWKTKKGKSVPFHPSSNPNAIVECHWDFCKKRKGVAQVAPPAGLMGQVSAESVRELLGAKVVMIVTADSWHADVMPGMDAEDAKHELITAANALRRAMGGR